MEHKGQTGLTTRIGVVLTGVLFASSALAGPVILGGDDLTDHGSVSIGASTPLPGNGVTVDESEANGTAAGADPIAIGNDYLGSLAPGSSPADVDFVSFSAEAGQRITVRTFLEGPTPVLSDSVLTLYGSNGTTQLANNDDFSGGGLASQIEYQFSSAGTYYLRVRAYCCGQNGSYRLALRGAEQAGAPVLQRGWLYIRTALINLAPAVTYPHHDGSVAVLGSADSTSTRGDAGAAYHYAVPQAGDMSGLSGAVSFYNGSAAINTFFTNLANGTAHPAIIVTAGTGARNDLDSAEGRALTANAQGIANFVNSGGGLLSHGSGSNAYGWLTTLIPGASYPSGCSGSTLSLTEQGQAAFPNLTNRDLRAGPCHNQFRNHGLTVLARDSSNREIIIGSAQTVLPGALTVTPRGAFKPVGTSHTVTANAVDSADAPVVGTTVTFTVINGPNAGATGTGTTDSAGNTDFSYTSNGDVGIDTIRASFVDENGATVITNARVIWDNDCNNNGLPDTCDTACSAFNGACALDVASCGGSADTNEDSIPDECVVSNTPPTALCQDASVDAPATQCFANASIDAGSSDPDGDAITLTQNPAGPYAVGTTNVTLTVNDGSASAMCAAAVTINDVTGPAITCPAAITAQCDGNLAANVDPAPASATDACGVTAVTDPPAGSFSLAASPHTVDYSATDPTGNASTCSTSVTVIDTIAPTITCPADIDTDADASCIGHADPTATAADICNPAPTVTRAPLGNDFVLGNTEVTHTVADGSGNGATCISNVLVVDRTPPTINCNARDITPPDATISFTATTDDNCGSTVEITSRDCFIINGAGRRVDKTGSCVVTFVGDTVTIVNSGGVGDNITWTAVATDVAGNVTETTCAIVVNNPGQGGGNGGGNTGTGCNQGIGNGSEGCDPGNSNNTQPTNDEGTGRGRGR